MPLTLTALKEAGLDSLTGGGAEIFQQDIRDTIAKGKETADEYLDVHRAWHQLGGRSTCTMLFGHVETLEDRIDHLSRLRTLQDETGGFTAFIPLPYQPENNEVPVSYPPTGNDILRTLAVSRLFLDNFDHLTAYWVGLGMKLAQVALSYGANDLHGTIVEEHIFEMAGADTFEGQAEDALVKAICETGRAPIQRNSFYEPVGESPGDSPPGSALEDNLATA
jgi:aminodeoxyfutalosine synthase